MARRGNRFWPDEPMYSGSFKEFRGSFPIKLVAKFATKKLLLAL